MIWNASSFEQCFCCFQLIFEGEVGKDYKGDIAIDDTNIDALTCKTQPATAVPVQDGELLGFSYSTQRQKNYFFYYFALT